MHKKIALFNSPLILAALGVAMVSGVAAAAEPASSDLSEIVVQSPRVFTVYSPWTRSREEHYVANVRVAYSDLNLTENAGVDALHSRVKTAAELACQKLSRLTPVADQACLQDTLAATQPRVQAAVNAAMLASAPAKQEQGRT